MASGPHRPGFYLGVLVAGFIAGGALTGIAVILIESFVL